MAKQAKKTTDKSAPVADSENVNVTINEKVMVSLPNTSIYLNMTIERIDNIINAMVTKRFELQNALTLHLNHVKALQVIDKSIVGFTCLETAMKMVKAMETIQPIDKWVALTTIAASLPDDKPETPAYTPKTRIKAKQNSTNDVINLNSVNNQLIQSVLIQYGGIAFSQLPSNIQSQFTIGDKSAYGKQNGFYRTLCSKGADGNNLFNQLMAQGKMINEDTLTACVNDGLTGSSSKGHMLRALNAYRAKGDNK